ncbi:RHS repeat-associated core domain-containing protein [Phytohabitans kaempferiae]|uniref:RHS repeat-associated core domain-containing protein n=1 Tax=Phytohabitans kaempferiae TaxID=1620943 RepID=A0ABV6M5B6_9ACTN
MKARSRSIAIPTAVAVLLATVAVAPAYASPTTALDTEKRRPPTQVTQSVSGRDATADPRFQPAAARLFDPPEVTDWPVRAEATVDVAGTGMAKAAALPVRVGRVAGTAAAPTQPVKVQLRDRTDAPGALLSVSAPDGGKLDAAVSLDIDYTGLAARFGGDFGSRLSIVSLPECAAGSLDRLVSPCQARPVRARNDARAGRLTVDSLPTNEATTFALAAGAGGPAGDYSASQLSASAGWNVSIQTGAFTWSYPFHTPPVPGGVAPELELSYSSSSVDGRTSSTNNQPSWLGEGHHLDMGYIERRYAGCADDMAGGNNSTKTGDLCWQSDNATLVFDGDATELVRDATTGQWRAKDDEGVRIERLTGAANGDNDGEYWRLTETDGTQYYFGRGKRYAADTDTNQSAWRVPVYGNHAGEPCNASTFAASVCFQAYRWNLDYVVDPHGDSMTLFYAAEGNYYGRNLNTAVSHYHRGGYLTRIDYGERAGSEHTTTAPARVVFTTAERCLPSGQITCDPAQLTAANAAHWPDVPFDQICGSTTSCANRFSPTFFSRKRLTGLTTQVLSGSSYVDATSWTFTHQFPNPGDGTSKALWLASIEQVGKVGGTAAMPKVLFHGVQLPNRVDGLDMAPPLVKWRVRQITTEAGGRYAVNYSAADCVPGSSMPTAAHTNSRRCFPAYWTPDGQVEPSLHYFHTYVVTSVVADDTTGEGVDEVTTYEYVDTPAWHYDDNELTPAKYRTWGQYRGYGVVRVREGAAGQQQSLTEHRFLRGMDDDQLPGGARRQVVVTDSEGGTVEDHPRLAGFELEQITYNGPGGAEVEATVSRPWISAPTATNGGKNAWLSDVATEITRRPLASGGAHRTRTVTTYDSYGEPSTVDDQGDVSTAADDRCTRFTYARNVTAWIVETEARAETVSVGCGATPSRPANVLSDERTYYDGSTTLGAAPTKGDLTRVEELDSWPASGPVYVATERATYDVHGRQTESVDALGRRATTAYTPASGGLTTSTVATNAAGHATTTTLVTATGEAASVVDANGKRTDIEYDPLGRPLKVWLPDRSKASGATPSEEYSYLLRQDGPVAVTTKTLLPSGAYRSSIHLYDSLMRPRQVQEPGAAGGRVLTDTVYDSQGRIVDQNGPYYNSSAPTTSLYLVDDAALPTQARTLYDGAGRTVADVFRVNGVEKWRTTYAYGGDRVHVDPPAGATATTTVSDAHGRTIQLLQHHGAAPTGTADTTRYTYTPRGDLETVTDPAGNTWRYQYDLRGRTIRADDPDRGVSTTTYDAAGQPVTATDARGTLVSTYDSLGRHTTIRDGSATGPLLAQWVYDTRAKGQLSTSTSYSASSAYVTEVTGYDNGYRPTGTRVTVPVSEGALAGTYTTTYTYNPDGSLKTVAHPAVGGLPAETLSYTYNAAGLPQRLGGVGAYVSNTVYSPFGEVLQLALGNTVGKTNWQTLTYEVGTRRLATAQVDRETVNDADSRIAYAYDAAGNPTSITDAAPGKPVDRQCFRYDHARRLVEAWTPTAACTGAPTVAGLGGPAPYWLAYTYDAAGNRLTQTSHAAAGQTRHQYAYPATGQPRPHAATSVTVSKPDGTSTTTNYGYDAVGNLSGRTGAAGAQTLTWTPRGELDSVTTPAGTSSHVYTADGDRLLRRDPTTVTLYLGDTELEFTRSTGVVKGTRHYSHGGVVIAVREGTSVDTLAADPHGTAHIAIDNATMAVQQRRSLPFGEDRGPAVNWPSERGFVGGAEDATGYTHLGAREYDPVHGRFVSADPVVDHGDPQQLNAYAYAANNPMTFTDPDGLRYKMDGGGLSKAKKTAKKLGKKPAKKPVAKKRGYVKKKRHAYKVPKKVKKTPRAFVKKRARAGYSPPRHAETVRDALLIVIHRIANNSRMFGVCLGTVTDSGTCRRAERDLSGRWTRATVDAICNRQNFCDAPAPDYLTLGFSYSANGATAGTKFTVARTGSAFAATTAGLGGGRSVAPLNGAGASAVAGWVYEGPPWDTRRASSSAIDDTLDGRGVSVGLTLGPFTIRRGLSTWVEEAGANTSWLSADVTARYGYRIGDLGDLW